MMNSSEKLIEREMDIDDVMWFIELCESNNIEVYIDGGWGVFVSVQLDEGFRNNRITN
ncbi:hypothetical protein H6801_03180 [Candidatus Nomurabacteria bacterium]|nr:hypothetical protein [Candidatus Nomurabacteria bacterium]